MAELKTKPTDLSVRAYLDAIDDETRRKDCRSLAALMKRVTRRKPVMWGTSIVGFGSYHYKYASGHEGDMCVVGFSSRKGNISIYLLSGFAGKENLLAELGKHKKGKGCLYVRRLADVRLPVLQELISRAVAEIGERYP
jgi:hypothetical protein